MYLKIGQLPIFSDNDEESSVYHIGIDIPFYMRFKYSKTFIHALNHFKKHTGLLRPIPLDTLAKFTHKGNKFTLLEILRQNYKYGIDYELTSASGKDCTDVLIFKNRDLCAQFKNYLETN